MSGKIMTQRNMRINPLTVPLIISVLTASIWLGAEINSFWLATLAGLNVIVSGIGVIRSVANGLRPVSAVFYIFTFAWLGVAPIVQISTNTVAWRDVSAFYDPGLVGTALGLNLAGTLAFMVGAEHARSRDAGRHLERAFPLAPARVRPWVFGAIIIASVTLLPLAIQANGGLASLFTSRRELQGLRSDLGTSMTDIGGPMYALTRILPGALAVTGALLSVYLLQADRASKARVKLSHILGMIVALGCLILFANPLANSRFTAASAFGAVLIACLRPRSKRSGFIFAAVMLTATLLIYPLANAFRSQNFNVKSGVAAFTSADFDGFQQVINTLNYVSDAGHTLGMQVLSGIGFFVPRSIWGEKADPASFAIAEHAGYIFTNLSLPIHAEFYLEFGWFGIIAGMMFLGFMAGRLDHAWLNEPNTKFAMIAPYASMAVLGIIRGPIGAQIPVWGAVIILLILGIAKGNEKLQCITSVARRNQLNAR